MDIVFDKDDGAELYSRAIGGPIGGGVLTYTDDGTADGRQLIAVASGMNSPVWEWKGGPAKITVLGLGDRAGVPGHL